MNRTEKQVFIADLAKGINASEAFAILSFNKLNVEKMTQFRLGLRKQDVRVRVLKNTLARIAFKETPFTDIMGDNTGPLLVAYGSKDAVQTAKAVYEWVEKDGFELDVKTGAAMGEQMSSEQMKALSLLPGREEMLVSFLWALKSPAQKFLYALTDAPNRLGYALGALKEKKEQEANA